MRGEKSLLVQCPIGWVGGCQTDQYLSQEQTAVLPPHPPPPSKVNLIFRKRAPAPLDWSCYRFQVILLFFSGESWYRVEVCEEQAVDFLLWGRRYVLQILLKGFIANTLRQEIFANTIERDCTANVWFWDTTSVKGLVGLDHISC